MSRMQPGRPFLTKPDELPAPYHVADVPELDHAAPGIEGSDNRTLAIRLQ
jgi:hypothetical protein